MLNSCQHGGCAQVLDTRYRSKTEIYLKKAFLPSLCRHLGSKHHMSSAQALSPCIRPAFYEAARLNLKVSASFSISPNSCPSKTLLLNSSLFSGKTFTRQRETYFHKKWSGEVRAQVELAAGIDVINNLGLDTLTFLAATVLIVPAFKAINQSPVRCLTLLTRLVVQVLNQAVSLFVQEFFKDDNVPNGSVR